MIHPLASRSRAGSIANLSVLRAGVRIVPDFRRQGEASSTDFLGTRLCGRSARVRMRRSDAPDAVCVRTALSPLKASWRCMAIGSRPSW